MTEATAGIPDAYGIEARHPGTLAVLERTFVQLAERLASAVTADSVSAAELAGLASVILRDAARGGNLETQMEKGARKAFELIVLLPKHGKATETWQLCCRYLLRGWELTTDRNAEAELADAILQLVFPVRVDVLSEMLEESLKTLKGEHARSRIKRLLNRANTDSNMLVLEIMLKRLVDVSAFPDTLALAHAVANA